VSQQFARQASSHAYNILFSMEVVCNGFISETFWNWYSG
jgi:hypothetical protein